MIPLVRLRTPFPRRIGPVASLALLVAALAPSACSDPEPDPGPPDGAALFRQQNCVQCHGAEGRGTNLGPALVDKKSFWTRETLAQYLTDPQARIQKDARLSKQADLYRLPMTKFVGLSLEQRLAIADHVLALP